MSQVKSIEAEEVGYSGLFVMAYYTLIFGATLSNFNLSIQYPLFALLSIIFLAVNMRESISYLHLVYLVIFFLSFLVHLIFFTIQPDKLFFSSVYYLIIPFIYGNSKMGAREIYNSLKICSYSSLFALIGLTGQMAGWLPFFKPEITDTLGEVHVRYTSFLGSSILLGFVSAINAIVLFFSIITGDRVKVKELFLFFASLACIVFSYTRGAYLMFFIGISVISVVHLKKVRKVLKFGLIIAILTLLLSAVLDLQLVLTRLYSFFDFTNEGGNVERLVKWVNAIKIFLNNFWFGTSPGSTGSVGVAKEDAWEYANSYGVVTESYVLKVFVENGVFVGSFFIAFYILAIYNSFKFLNSPEKKLLIAIFLAIIVESFTLQSLESPLISMIFWVCFSSMAYDKEDLNDEESVNYSPT